jgi:hypothetical protein
MPYWWWFVPIMVGLLALAVLVGGLTMPWRRPIRAVAELASSAALLAIAAAALALGLDIQTFSRLTYERPIATIVLHQVGDKQFDAALTLADTVTPPFATQPVKAPPAPQIYSLKGDEWRIEARVLKWKPWANVLGLDARYRLERLSGEFTDTAQELNGPRSAYALRPTGDGGLSVLSKRLNEAQLVDTLYGSAALMPMADGAQYSLAMTQTGLVARPANEQAAQAVGGWK